MGHTASDPSLGIEGIEVLSGARLPPRLRDLPEPPSAVYVRGQLPRGPAVAIVGTRRPSGAAETFASELASQLARAGFSVLSGGAEGIDAAAHRGALAVSGETVVVSPSGLDRPYPEQHADLFARIVSGGGALLSPFAAGSVARRHQFFTRNAVLAALADALVLVEAPIRSGARNACAWARRLGRPWYVVPAAPWHPAGRGCLVELELGARPLTHPTRFIRHLQDRGARVVCGPSADFSIVDAPGSVAEPRFDALDEPLRTAGGALRDEAALLGVLALGPCSPDALVEVLGWSAAHVQHQLFLLTLEGRVAQDTGGSYRCT